jgi:hypothetical protein
MKSKIGHWKSRTYWSLGSGHHPLKRAAVASCRDVAAPSGGIIVVDQSSGSFASKYDYMQHTLRDVHFILEFIIIIIIFIVVLKVQKQTMQIQ